MRPIFCLIIALMAALSASSALAQSPQKWVTSWTGSVQGPYPIGNAAAQPDLRFAFPSPETGARDQSFRLIVRPDLWGRQVRLRFSNALELPHPRPRTASTLCARRVPSALWSLRPIPRPPVPYRSSLDSPLEGRVTSELVSEVDSGARKNQNQIFRGFG